MSQRLGRLQLAIMQVLWQRGSATVADIQGALKSDRSAAYSTIATVLGRMERRDLVSHRIEGRTFIYEPVISEDQVSSSLVSDLVDRAFNGSPSQLVSHLLESDEVNSQELSRIKALVKQHEQGE